MGHQLQTLLQPFTQKSYLRKGQGAAVRNQRTGKAKPYNGVGVWETKNMAEIIEVDRCSNMTASTDEWAVDRGELERIWHRFRV